MGFNNGVPISVVSNIVTMPTSAESSSRRRAEQDARTESDKALNRGRRKACDLDS